MPTELEIAFHHAMEEIYQRAKDEAGYNATTFRGMVAEHGGVETARRLLNASQVSDGYTALWESKRLDLTMEAMLVGRPEFHPLFTFDARLELNQTRVLPCRHAAGAWRGSMTALWRSPAAAEWAGGRFGAFGPKGGPP